MEFALSQEQRLSDDSLRGYLADRLPMDRLRALADSGSGFDADLWHGMNELGLHGLLVPERFGGAGLGVLDAAVAAEARPQVIMIRASHKRAPTLSMTRLLGTSKTT